MKTDNLHAFSSYDNTAFQKRSFFAPGCGKKKKKKLKKTAKVLARLQPKVLKTIFSGIFCTALLEEAALEESGVMVDISIPAFWRPNLVQRLVVSLDTALYGVFQLINCLVSKPLKDRVRFR